MYLSMYQIKSTLSLLGADCDAETTMLNRNGPAICRAVLPRGGVAEWSIAAVLKTVGGVRASPVGSNPTPSAFPGKSSQTHYLSVLHD
jgi:hypothetical protein